MKIYPYILSILAIISLAGCTESNDIIDTSEDEYVYSFTAVLNETQSRISYHEDGNKSPNLKMVWDEGDEIRLYPDNPEEGEPEYYKFVANTGKGIGTQRAVFVHQGYILNWENWSGKAIYVFPNGENLNVENKDFENNFQTQISNNNTDHLKYAEHVSGADGSKQYTEYWTDYLENYNLKHDHEMYFRHPQTVVYAIKLRGFIYDIPGGSILKVSGAKWVDGDTITLNLGTKDDKEPFLKVGEFGCSDYDKNAVLTAYIIRQVVGETDGYIAKGDSLRIDLLSYDKDDGKTYPLDAKDEQTHRTSIVATQGYYFKNLPWGDEYTWKVHTTADINYNVGDYVVCDLTDTTNNASYPRIAIDLGLPRKWAAYNVGAKRIDDYGNLFAWGYTNPHNLYQSALGSTTFPNKHITSWDSGNPENDAATAMWGEEWITPTEKEMFDLVYYCPMADESGNVMPLSTFLPSTSEYQWKDLSENHQTNIYEGTEGCYLLYNDVILARLRSTFNNRYFYWPMSGSTDKFESEGFLPGTRGYYWTNSWYTGVGPYRFFILHDTYYRLAYRPIEAPHYTAYSVRAIKRYITK